MSGRPRRPRPISSAGRKGSSTPSVATTLQSLRWRCSLPGGQVTDAQRNQLRAVAEGTGRQRHVRQDAHLLGREQWRLPVRRRPGRTSPAVRRRDRADLRGERLDRRSTCPSTECPKGRFTFDLDPGVGGFRVVADVGARGAQPTLVTPDGTRLDPSHLGQQDLSRPGRVARGICPRRPRHRHPADETAPIRGQHLAGRPG